MTHLNHKSSEQIEIVDEWCYDLRGELSQRGRLLCELMSLSISRDQSIGETLSTKPTKIGCYLVLMGWGVIFMN